MIKPNSETGSIIAGLAMYEEARLRVRQSPKDQEPELRKKFGQPPRRAPRAQANAVQTQEDPKEIRRSGTTKGSLLHFVRSAHTAENKTVSLFRASGASSGEDNGLSKNSHHSDRHVRGQRRAADERLGAVESDRQDQVEPAGKPLETDGQNHFQSQRADLVRVCDGGGRSDAEHHAETSDPCFSGVVGLLDIHGKLESAMPPILGSRTMMRTPQWRLGPSAPGKVGNDNTQLYEYIPGGTTVANGNQRTVNPWTPGMASVHGAGYFGTSFARTGSHNFNPTNLTGMISLVQPRLNESFSRSGNSFLGQQIPGSTGGIFRTEMTFLPEPGTIALLGSAPWGWRDSGACGRAGTDWRYRNDTGVTLEIPTMCPGCIASSSRRGTPHDRMYGPRGFVSITESMMSTDISWARRASGMPALCTRIGTRPSLDIAFSTT